ncbi:beta-2 adrenergic receptor-like [Argopecten irradians]|uniref:beta-2 adrenergic receptor-like n=1 Tax=Argopecten irradians TaxID=31199 RepID=UPI0037229ADE
MTSVCNIPPNSSAYNEYEYVTDTAPTWISVVVTLVGVVTIVVNIPAAIAVILTKIKTPTTRNTHLLILGITDIFAGVSLFPMLKTFQSPNSKISYWTCFLRMFFFMIIYYNSMGQICVICIDRVFLLSRPSWKYTSMYERRYFSIFCVIILVTSSWACFIFFINRKPNAEVIECKLDTLFCQNLYHFSGGIGGAALLIQSLIATCSVAMIVTLWRHRRKHRQIIPANREEMQTQNTSHDPDTQENQNARMTTEAKSTLTIIIINMILIVFVTPMNFGFLLQGLRLAKPTNRSIRFLITSLSCMNSAINPFIYCFRTPEVKAILNDWFFEINSAVFKDILHR